MFVERKCAMKIRNITLDTGNICNTILVKDEENVNQRKSKVSLSVIVYPEMYENL